jgi:regulatory protein YycI of two-component signal transduction system YycFG
MDLTLFIIVILLIIIILYGISILKDVKQDIRKISGNNDNLEDNNIILYIKDSLEYLKNLL